MLSGSTVKQCEIKINTSPTNKQHIKSMTKSHKLKILTVHLIDTNVVLLVFSELIP